MSDYVGRSDSETDDAPLDIYTTIMLKPREQWRKGMTYDQRIADMNDQLPWQNAYIERVIGSIRRECLDRSLGQLIFRFSSERRGRQTLA